MWFRKKKQQSNKVENVIQIKPNLKGVKDEIYKWNSLYPLDKWWRDKYKISYNSDEHRNSCLLDIAQEYQEQKIFNKMYEDFSEPDYKKGNWIDEVEIKMSDEDTIAQFEKFLNV